MAAESKIYAREKFFVKMKKMAVKIFFRENEKMAVKIFFLENEKNGGKANYVEKMKKMVVEKNSGKMENKNGG